MFQLTVHVLGNKAEMDITNYIEHNPTLVRVGLFFEFNDARSRVATQLQKNIDRGESVMTSPSMPSSPLLLLLLLS